MYIYNRRNSPKAIINLQVIYDVIHLLSENMIAKTISSFPIVLLPISSLIYDQF